MSVWFTNTFHTFAEKARLFLEASNEQNLDRLALEVTTGAPE
jgi:hypothetical protein